MTDTAAPAPRIPNVHPHAVSGLAHTPLNEAPEPAAAEQADSVLYPPVPEDLHTVDGLRAWVAEPEDGSESVSRAVSVLLVERASDKPRSTLVEPLERHVLDFILDGAEVEVPESEVEGVEVPDDGVAGTGEAVNADTGEVTEAGDPLPPIESGDPDVADPAPEA